MGGESAVLEFDCSTLVEITDAKLNISEVKTEIGFTNRYLTKGGKIWIPVMGEFHFARYPYLLWEDEILKMKASGITVISTYLFWIFHEETEGHYNFKRDRDLKHFVKLCYQHHMLVILRIGPWCHGEVRYGGFPYFIQKREDKRSNSPAYLEKVRLLFQQYYQQVKDYLYPHGNVIGIQLENEYEGADKNHIQILRSLSVDVGFRLPLYTYTAWPVITDAVSNMLPMFGGYPERPWVQNTAPLELDDRFHIVNSRVDDGIGCDILKPSIDGNLTYDSFPYATCELGCGVQVTEHRRPIIDANDTYAMLLVCLAKGLNYLGYYMYHGGRNPYGGLYQESRSTNYPNNYPIISYDFQAPISEYGYVRESYYKHKLIHYFLTSFSKEFGETQSIFAKETKDGVDKKVGIRISKDDQGFVFLNNYQRLVPFHKITESSIQIHSIAQTIGLPLPCILQGVTFFYPFHLQLSDIEMEYIIAQPICKFNKNNRLQVYFLKINQVQCRFKTTSRIHTQASKQGEEYQLGEYAENSPVITSSQCDIFIISEARAKELWFFDKEILWSKNFILPYEEHIVEFVERKLDVTEISLRQVPRIKHPYDKYLYSSGIVTQYELNVPSTIFQAFYDYKLCFHWIGNVMQIYLGGKLMADYFNYDGTVTIGLKRFEKEIRKGSKFTIILSPIDLDRDIYFEKNLARNTTFLKIDSIRVIERKITKRGDYDE